MVLPAQNAADRINSSSCAPYMIKVAGTTSRIARPCKAPQTTSSCELACAAAQIDTPSRRLREVLQNISATACGQFVEEHADAGILLPLGDLDPLTADQSFHQGDRKRCDGAVRRRQHIEGGAGLVEIVGSNAGRRGPGLKSAATR